jgi:hypothetical protein
MASEDDDFQELSELLFGAKELYRSVRAEITHTVVGFPTGTARCGVQTGRALNPSDLPRTLLPRTRVNNKPGVL